MSGQPLRGDRCRFALLLAGSHLRGNFFSEVVDRLLDAFAYFVVSEGNDFSTGFLSQFANLDFRVLDERLLDQAGFSKELADATSNHLLDDFGGLALDLIFVKRQENFLFLSI